ncbi:MAG: ATP-binding protein [Spirosomataceae bacterium]
MTNNTDSLEKALKPERPDVYLKQLLVLEKSWFESANPKYGSKRNEVRALAIKLKRKDALALLTFTEGKSLMKQRRNPEAFKAFTDVLRSFEELKDTLGIIKTLGRLSHLSYKLSNPNNRNADAALDFAKKTVAMAEKYGDKFFLVDALVLLSNAYAFQGNKKDELRKVLYRQLKIIGNDKSLEEFKSDVSNHLAHIYISEGKYEKAYQNFKDFEILNKKYLIIYDYYDFLLELGEVCLLTNRFDEGKKNIDYVQNRVNSKGFELLKLRVFSLYRKLYESKNDYKKALAYSDSSNILQEKIYKTENTENLNKLQVAYKTKELQNQNMALSKENDLVKSRNTTILIAVIGAVILITLLLTVLYYLNQGRKKAQLQAEEINKLSQIRDQYIRIIAHDLRSPIYAMQGMYDMVNRAIKTKHFEDLQRISNYIDETGIKTKHLLDNLLNWGMSQQEEVPYEPQKLNVIENINEVISVYESAKDLKNFTITINSNSENYVYADKQGFQLILRNLVDNAIKNLPPNNGIIDISVSADADNNVSIKIQDNGKGIPEERLVTINTVFDKPHSVVMGKNGLGLGITLIGKFVKRNKGFITVQSVVNSGSKFTLSLPVA